MVAGARGDRVETHRKYRQAVGALNEQIAGALEESKPIAGKREVRVVLSAGTYGEVLKPDGKGEESGETYGWSSDNEGMLKVQGGRAVSQCTQRALSCWNLKQPWHRLEYSQKGQCG